MKYAVHTILAVGLAAACWGTLTGCDADPPPGPFAYNLGDASRPLPPAPPAKRNTTLAQGTAEWVEIRIPSEDSFGQPPAPTSPDAAIREMLESYNQAVADDAWEELPEYYIEAQQEPARQLIAVTTKTIEKYQQLAAALNEKQAGSGAVVEALVEQTRNGLVITVTDITVEGESAASAKLVLPQGAAAMPGMEVVKFALVEEVWYIDYPYLTTLAAMLPMIEASLAQVDQWVAQLAAGQLTPEQLAPQLQAMQAMAAGGQPPATAETAPPAAEEPPAAETPEEEKPKPPPAPSG